MPAIALSLALIAAACSSGGDNDADDTTVPTDGDTATTTPTEAEPTASEDGSTTVPTPSSDIPRQPLTGEPVDDPGDVIDRPALAVKVDNHPDSRQNQSGLAVADIVFEQIVEGGYTRFLAVFHANDSDPVGPIRSSRSQDVGLLEPFNSPLFATSGANPGVNRLIDESPIIDVSAQQDVDGYVLGAGSSPHNLYNDTDSLWAEAPDDHPGPPTQQFEYLLPDEPFVGDANDGFDLRIGEVDVGWRWDPSQDAWQRSQSGFVHDDQAHGPIAANNVIVMVVAYGRSAIDVNSPEARTVGDGLALVFSDGQSITGTWSRPTADAPISFLDPSGSPVALTPGNTWIELVAGDPENPVAPVEFLRVT